MKFFIYLSPLIFLLLFAGRVIELILITNSCVFYIDNNKFGSTVMHAIIIPYDMIHICMHRSREGQRLERAANMIVIFIATNNN